MVKLYPKLYVDDVESIDFKLLKSKGYNSVLFDVDNTLVPFDQLEAHEGLISFIEGLVSLGFKVCLVSNNSRNRVEMLNKDLKLTILPNAMKPLKYKLKKLLKDIDCKPTQGIFVGDQLFTDVWVGNRIGLYTILVKPIQLKEQFITKIKRKKEKKILEKYLKKEGRSYED